MFAKSPLSMFPFWVMQMTDMEVKESITILDHLPRRRDYV